MYIRNAPPVLNNQKNASDFCIAKSNYARQLNVTQRNKAGNWAMASIAPIGLLTLFDAGRRHGWDSLITEANLPYTYWILISPLGAVFLASIYFNNAKKTSAWSFHSFADNAKLKICFVWTQLPSRIKDISGECTISMGSSSPPQDIMTSQSIYIYSKNKKLLSELDVQDSLLEAHDICKTLEKFHFISKHNSTLIKRKDRDYTQNSFLPKRTTFKHSLPPRHTPLSAFIAVAYCATTFFFTGIATWLSYKFSGDINQLFDSATTISPFTPFIILGISALFFIPALIFSIKAAYLGLFPLFGTRTLTIHPDGHEFTERGLRKVRQQHRVGFDEITEVFVNEGELGHALHLFGKTHLVVRWDKASFAVLGDGMSVEELFELQAAIEHTRNAYFEKHALAEPV